MLRKGKTLSYRRGPIVAFDLTTIVGLLLSLRTTDIWNKLSNNIVNHSSLRLFKINIDNLFVHTKYVVDREVMISKI